MRLAAQLKKQTQTDALEKLKQEHKKISTKIDNIVNAIAESGASALLSSLESLEEQRNIITQKISNCEKANEPIPIDEDAIRAAYKEAKTLFLSGDIEMQKRLINQYLIKVVTYKDHIEIFLNEIPSTMLKGEEDKIIEYVTANGAAQETGCSLFLRKKIADNPDDLAKLSTETGGGEPPTPSVVYLNLERTEYELCGLVRLLIMGKQTLKKGYKDL